VTQVRACVDALVQSQLYALAARALADPDRLATGDPVSDLERVASGPVAQAAAATRSLLRERAPTRRGLSQEYTELFLKGTVSPYESSYVPSMQGLATLADVSGFLRAFGLKPRTDRADHVVSELELLAFLCVKEGVALGSGEAPQARLCHEARAAFLRDHAGRWLPAYQRALAARAPRSIYTSLVDLVRMIVETDAAAVGVSPEEIQEVPSVGDASPPTCGVVR